MMLPCLFFLTTAFLRFTAGEVTGAKLGSAAEWKLAKEYKFVDHDAVVSDWWIDIVDDKGKPGPGDKVVKSPEEITKSKGLTNYLMEYESKKYKQVSRLNAIVPFNKSSAGNYLLPARMDGTLAGQYSFSTRKQLSLAETPNKRMRIEITVTVPRGELGTPQFSLGSPNTVLGVFERIGWVGDPQTADSDLLWYHLSGLMVDAVLAKFGNNYQDFIGHPVTYGFELVDQPEDVHIYAYVSNNGKKEIGQPKTTGPYNFIKNCLAGGDRSICKKAAVLTGNFAAQFSLFIPYNDVRDTKSYTSQMELINVRIYH